MPVSIPDKLMLCDNGEVIDWDPEVIEAASRELREKPGYYARFCLPKGGCANCQMPACPITD